MDEKPVRDQVIDLVALMYFRASNESEFPHLVVDVAAPSPAGLSPLLDQLDEARAAGTRGPWKIRDDGVTVEIEGGDRESVRDKHGFHDADVALIVAAVNALPQLTAAIRAVAEQADGLEVEAAERQRMADRLPNQPAYHMEINRLVVAAEHQRRCAKQIRRILIAALTPGADTAGATA